MILIYTPHHIPITLSGYSSFRDSPMATDSSFLSTKRYAVVTGGNKGIGLEICRQLASKGVLVVLTARDEKRGREAVEKLKSTEEWLSVEFHQLDVADPASVASLADFIKTQFGKLDVLVNNAGVSGIIINDPDLLRAEFAKPSGERNFEGIITETYEMAEECFNINYYGAKRTAEALLPLLKSSDSPRIVNVSSGAGKLENIPNERIRAVLDNVEEDMKEEKIDEILDEFLKDFKEGHLVEKRWPSTLPAYTVSKVAMNAYTRILSKACHPAGVDVNCVCPGFVKTDINANSGYLTAEEGAESPVRLALLPKGESSGVFYIRKEAVPF